MYYLWISHLCGSNVVIRWKDSASVMHQNNPSGHVDKPSELGEVLSSCFK